MDIEQRFKYWRETVSTPDPVSGFSGVEIDQVFSACLSAGSRKATIVAGVFVHQITDMQKNDNPLRRPI